MTTLERKLFGLIGHPIRHSLSPALHKYLLQNLGVAGTYNRFEVENGQLDETIQDLQKQGFAGFNVTIPHKQSVKAFIHEISDEAALIGSVNTVALRDDRLIGYNTDAVGFALALKNRGVDFRDKAVVILGAGGAARAVVFVLIHAGIKKIFLFNRNRRRAESLSEELGKATGFNNFELFEFDANRIGDKLELCHLIVNATPVGMWPESGRSPYIFKAKVEGLVAVDLVYNPLETEFLKSAGKAGVAVIDGLDMFIFQGIESMKIWLEIRKPLTLNHTDIRNHLIKELNSWEK